MTRPLNSFLLFSFLLALSFTVALSSKHDYSKLKSLHLTVYCQETVNKTAYLMVKGVDTGVLSPRIDALPFGNLYVFHNSLTTKVNRSSKAVGAMEGIIVVSGLDGLQSINVMKIRLSLKEHKGSISVVGAAPNAEPGDLTVVGGTGDFMFVQGYVTTSTIVTTPPNVTYKIELHLYWPPYATNYIM